MNAFLLMIGLILGVILLLPPMFKQVTKGKIYTLFIEDDGYVNAKLKKPQYNNEYIVDGEGAYEIIPGGDYIGLTAFPKGFFPAFFQTILPCILYRRDDPIPMSIRNPILKAVTSKEIKLGLEPHFLTGLAKHSQEGVKEGKLKQMLPMLTLVILAITLLMILIIWSRLGSLENLIKLVRPG